VPSLPVCLLHVAPLPVTPLVFPPLLFVPDVIVALSLPLAHLAGIMQAHALMGVRMEKRPAEGQFRLALGAPPPFPPDPFRAGQGAEVEAAPLEVRMQRRVAPALPAIPAGLVGQRVDMAPEVVPEPELPRSLPLGAEADAGLEGPAFLNLFVNPSAGIIQIRFSGSATI